MKDVYSLDSTSPEVSSSGSEGVVASHDGVSPSFLTSKRVFDFLVALATLPTLIGLSLVLLILNPFWNRGGLIIAQKRAGYGGRDFSMYKFRTMLDVPEDSRDKVRGADDPLEVSRITPLGHWLRRTKMDEVPQILNVLLGEMSIVGPRPELASFVDQYRSEVPNYTTRWSVRPGMTGYAQVIQGYTDSTKMVRRKTELDNFYVRNISWKLDLKILAQTVKVVMQSEVQN